MENDKTIKDSWNSFKEKFLKYGKKYLIFCGISMNAYFVFVILILIFG